MQKLLGFITLLPLAFSTPIGEAQIAKIQNAGETLKNALAGWYENALEDDSEWAVRYTDLYENHYQTLYDVCYRLAEFEGATKDKTKLARFLGKKIKLIRAIIAAWDQMDAVQAAADRNAADAADVAEKFANAVAEKLARSQQKFQDQSNNAADQAQRVSDKNAEIEKTKMAKQARVDAKTSDDIAVFQLKHNRLTLKAINEQAMNTLKENKTNDKNAKIAAKNAAIAAKLLKKAQKACQNKGEEYPC